MMGAAQRQITQAPARAAIPEAVPARQTLVIVGNGMTSWRLCQELVESGAAEALRIVVFGAERFPAYDRVRLTSLLGGGRVEDLILAGEDWYADAGIELRLGDPVVAIDREECLVRSASGAEIFYDRLVLATGSVPFVPPIPGASLPGVFVYRTIDDLQAIRAAARGRGRAVVVGGGLLGLEAARAAADLGLTVQIVEGGPRLLQRQLDDAGGQRLRAIVEGMGLTVHTGRRTAGIVRQGGELHVALDTGEVLTADLVILSAGVRPSAELAASAGLELAATGGVAVDDGLQTSDDRVFAVGECASHGGTTYGLVAPGYQMVNVLAANLVGGKASFRSQVPATKLKVLGVSVVSVGEIEATTPGTIALTWEHEGAYRKLLLRRGRLVGALAVGPWEGFERVSQAVQARLRTTPWDLRRFRSRGELWGSRPTSSVVAWPDDAIVCACMQVTRGQIVEACANGAGTLAKVCRATSAGTMCGGCKPLIEQLVQITPVRLRPTTSARQLAVAPAGTPPRPLAALAAGSIAPVGRSSDGLPRRLSMPPFQAVRASRAQATTQERGAGPLAAAAIAAVLLAAALAFGPALPLPETALGDRFLTWIDLRSTRLISGFAILGLAALSLLLTARKRLRLFRSFSVGAWRAVHGVLGTLAALATALHTGGHLGVNLNRWLMIAFLVAVATGGAAGLLRRRRLSWLHVLVLLPLPALLVLHVLCAFYYA
jgi:nitrite reductase (NADH) large subunit